MSRTWAHRPRHVIMSEAIKAGYGNSINQAFVHKTQIVTVVVEEYRQQPSESALQAYCGRIGAERWEMKTYVEGEKYTYNVFGSSWWLERRLQPRYVTEPIVRKSTIEMLAALKSLENMETIPGVQETVISETHTLVAFIKTGDRKVIKGAQYGCGYEYMIAHDDSGDHVISADMFSYCHNTGQKWRVRDDAKMLPSCWDRKDMPYFRSSERRKVRDDLRRLAVSYNSVGDDVFSEDWNY